MQLKVLSVRRSRHSVYNTQYVLEAGAKEAEKLVGKNVEWKTASGKKIRGKISGLHGPKGNVKAIMEKGLPGQAVGTSIEVK